MSSIHINDYSVAVDQTPTQGSTNAVSSGGVFTSLGNYMPLSGDITSTGHVTFESWDTAKPAVVSHSYGFYIDKTWFGKPRAMTVWGNNAESGGPTDSSRSIGLCVTARTCLFVGETAQNSADYGSIVIGLHTPAQKHNCGTHENAYVYHRATRSGNVFSYHEVDFGNIAYPTRLVGTSVSLVVKGADGETDTVLELDASKMQKLKDFIDTL